MKGEHHYTQKNLEDLPEEQLPAARFQLWD